MRPVGFPFANRSEAKGPVELITQQVGTHWNPLRMFLLSGSTKEHSFTPKNCAVALSRLATLRMQRCSKYYADVDRWMVPCWISCAMKVLSDFTSLHT